MSTHLLAPNESRADNVHCKINTSEPVVYGFILCQLDDKTQLDCYEF